MRSRTWLAVALAASLGATALLSQPAPAVRLSDGRVYFVQPPRLLNASTTESLTYAWGARYYFTLSVPENAGEPLQRVEIAQRDGRGAARQVDYDLEDTRAFVGTRRQREAELPLGQSVYNSDTQTIAVTFDPPVAPGTTVTIALNPERNPRVGGTYLFGVTAYPAGESAYGQFLGYGRFQFDEPETRFDLF